MNTLIDGLEKHVCPHCKLVCFDAMDHAPGCPQIEAMAPTGCPTCGGQGAHLPGCKVGSFHKFLAQHTLDDTDDNDPERAEWTAEDFQHAIPRLDRLRMCEGKFQPGDIETLRRFCRMTEEQMAEACACIHYRIMREMDANGLLLRTAFSQLLRVAAISPHTFRQLLPKEKPDDE